MISRTLANTIELMEFIFFTMLHVIYATYFFEVESINKIFCYAVGMSALAGICLTVIKNLLWSQIGYIICVMVATYLIGTDMQTLAYGLCVYMVTGAIVSIVGNMKLNIIYIVITNISIIVGIVTQYDVITSTMRIEYYLLLVLFCEMFLIAENLLVMLYQQKVEEAETQNVLLSMAQKSKDEFLANMSHEIRTPMNAIVGMSELIMRENDISDKIKGYCYNMQISGENLLGIINDILDFSKIESGKLDIVYEPYSIASVIQDVASTAMFRRGFKDIDIIIDCGPNMPKQLFGDVMRNRQILMNIVSNAVKFTEKGYVFISLTCFEREGENWLRMKVKDTGIGIKKEDQVHLFESFSRIDTQRNRSIEGTGLGLAICKRLTQAMHGTIRIESEYEKGTTLIVEIPQKISDVTPFLKVKQKEGMQVVLYGDKEQYQTHGDKYYKFVNDHLWSELGISCRTITDFVKLTKEVGNGTITHVFIGIGEYTDQKSYFDQIAKTIQVFVVFDPQYPIKISEHVHGVQMPFYSVNLVSALNGEAFYNQLINDNEVRIAFKAPKARVMVVDDNDINLRVAEGILKMYEVDCVLAPSGKKAIELLKNQDIDVVFMDHMMPEMDGIETANIIRRSGGEYGKKLPIIALTANAVNNAKSMFLKHGFQDFLSKPFGIKDLDVVLRRWLPGTKIELFDEADRKPIQILGEEEFDAGVASYEEKPENVSIKADATIQKAAGEQSQKVADATSSQEDGETDKGFVPMEVNEETALVNMGGQRDLFKELLEYSLELEEVRKNEINESYDQKDWKEYMIRVHALKGGMRSLGVEEIAKLAQEQEAACKEDRIEDAIAGHEHLMKEYDRAHRSIELFLSTMEV